MMKLEIRCPGCYLSFAPVDHARVEIKADIAFRPCSLHHQSSRLSSTATSEIKNGVHALLGELAVYRVACGVVESGFIGQTYELAHLERRYRREV